HSLKNPRIFHKNVWCILVACYFADLAEDAQLTHLHAHFATYPALVALLMGKLTGINYTLTTHAHDIFLDKILLNEKIQGAKAVATISQYNRHYLGEHCGADILPKIHIVHCGLDLKEWDYQPRRNGRQGKTIVCVGRLTNMKGFENLIHACQLIKDEVDFRCHIVGDGDLRPRFEQLIRDYGLNDRIVLEGVLDSAEVRKLIQQADVFAVPSIWDDGDGQDGIPLVLMEALALGTPSVASRISGIPELIIDGQTGLLAEPGDVQTLADKMKRLLADKALQERLASSGRKKIEEEFDIAKNAKELARLF
ncbi:MAG: glycosyltransferase family 4 protein, partial [Candidatus Omnitrophica bacterium]|nr:glycosyltransferase family 4 protein [Candidatus Omnitrophota bacterium]